MARTIALVLGAAAAIGAIALYAWMEWQPDHSTMALQPAIPMPPPPTAEQSAVPPPLVFEAEALDAGAVGKETASHEEEPPPLPASVLPPLAGQVTANWEDTQRRRTYGDLLKSMRLAPADEQRFLALLASRYAGETEEDERAARETEMALQGLLKGHWPQFAAYEQEMEERIYVMQCDEVMAARDAGLVPEQRRQLVTVMAQVRRSLATQATDQPDAWMQTERVFQANILANAAGILQPDQLPAFREALQQQIEATQLAQDLVPNTASGATPALPIPGR